MPRLARAGAREGRGTTVTEPARWASSRPKTFFNVRVHDTGLEPTLLALCASYDDGQWRAEEFCDFLFEYMPEFALSHSELRKFNGATAVRLIRRAAKSIYKSEKFKARGEFGELILHAALREVFDTEPAVSKIFYKSSRNQTVHGFDSVHVTFLEDKLQLLLGEAKFYTRIGKAIDAVVGELELHTDRDYLRDECMIIANHFDEQWPYTSALRDLIDEGRPLDDIFADIRMPVLLTYDSAAVGGHTAPTAEYLVALEEEVRTHHGTFSDCELPSDVKVDLILVPLFSKKEFVAELDRKLKLWQSI